jgi:hypothetical protein
MCYYSVQMRKSKKINHGKRLVIGCGLLVVVVVAISGGLYYHHYEYQALSFKFSNDTGATISRHNIQEMTPAERQGFYHPVNEDVLHSCTGNPQDQCIATPSIDVWPGGSEGASNPYLNQSSGSDNEIMGRISNDTTDTLQLKTTSGRIISVAYPLNAISNFNENYASGYNLTITDGDEIYVSYMGSMKSGDTIETSQIISSSLILKNESATYPKY